MGVLVLYALLTASVWYLLARARITAPLWSRYPKRVAILVDCASCCGFYLGIIVSAALQENIFFLAGGAWTTHVVVGLLAIVWTPLVASLHQAAMYSLGTALPEDEHGDS